MSSIYNKGMIKDADSQPDEETHKVRSIGP